MYTLNEIANDIVQEFGDNAEPCGPYILIRLDDGCGGWSLHTREQLTSAGDDFAEYLLEGEAEYDDETREWNRPNAEDIAKATEISNA